MHGFLISDLRRGWEVICRVQSDYNACTGQADFKTIFCENEPKFDTLIYFDLLFAAPVQLGGKYQHFICGL